jgi:hypothetical protein
MAMVRNVEVMLGQILNNSAEFCNFGQCHIFVIYKTFGIIYKINFITFNDYIYTLQSILKQCEENSSFQIFFKF